MLPKSVDNIIELQFLLDLAVLTHNSIFNLEDLTECKASQGEIFKNYDSCPA